MAAEPVPPPGAVAVPLWLAGVIGLAAIALFVVPVLAPAIAAETGLAPSLVGLYSGIVWAAAIVGSLYAGRLIARYGGWALAQACLLLCAAGVALTVSGAPAALIAGAIVIGIGQGLEAPAAAHLLAGHVPPPRRPWLFSVKQSGSQVGGIVGAVLLPLIAVWIGWRGAAIAVVVLCAGGALLLMAPRRRWPGEPPAGAAAPTHFGIASLLRQPGDLRRLAGAAAAFGATQICLNSFFVTYAVEVRGDPLAQAGRWFAALQFGGLAGRLLLGWTAARLGIAGRLLRALGIAMTIGTATLGGFGAALPAWLLVPVVVVFGFAASGWNGIFLAEIARLAPPTQAGAATGAVMIVMTVGLVAGPLAFAAVAAASSFGSAYLALTAIAALGTWLLPAAGGDAPPPGR
ncbi:MAG: MFS transporter [Lautropia sp.]